MPAEHEHTVTAVVDRAAVWSLWTDVAGWPRLDPGVRKARLHGPVARGALGWVQPVKGPRWVFRIAEADPGAGRFVVEAALLLATLTVEREITRADPDASAPHAWRLAHRVRIRGPLAGLWDRALGRPIAEGFVPAAERVVAAAGDQPRAGGA